VSKRPFTDALSRSQRLVAETLSTRIAIGTILDSVATTSRRSNRLALALALALRGRGRDSASSPSRCAWRWRCDGWHATWQVLCASLDHPAICRDSGSREREYSIQDSCPLTSNCRHTKQKLPLRPALWLRAHLCP